MYLPLHVDLRGKKVLVVGFGEVGKRRAGKLLKAGAEVTVLEPRKTKIGRSIKLIQKKLKPADVPPLKEYFLVIAATNDRKLNAAITRKAKQEGCLVNRADLFEDGNVVFPAVAETSVGTISFCTLGKDPRLSKKIMELFEHGVSKH